VRKTRTSHGAQKMSDTFLWPVALKSGSFMLKKSWGKRKPENFLKFLKIFSWFYRPNTSRRENGGEGREMRRDNFKSIVSQYEKLVFTICFQLVHDYQEAQNLTQETFLSAYRHLDSCREDNIKPWLARIAANKAKDHLKSAYMRRVRPEDDMILEHLIPGRSDPLDLYLARENRESIVQIIRSLREPYLKVAVLYFLEEKTPYEIAVLLKRPKKTVETQLYRGKILLQNLLKEEGLP